MFAIGNIDSGISRLAVALKCYRHCSDKEVERLTPELVEEFHMAVDNMEDAAVRKFVQTEINKQVIDMFDGLAEADKLRASATPRNSNNDTHSVPVSTRTNFSLAVKPSPFSNAGDGVFLNRTTSHAQKQVIPGTVVCLYPGLVHLKEYLKEMSYFRSILPDPNYMLMARTDQSLIDGRTANLSPQNPFAVAHKINHCGDINRPNVLQVSDE